MQRHAQIPRHPPRITHTKAHEARQGTCERRALAAHQWQPTECLEARFLPFASLAQKQHHQPRLTTHYPHHLSTCRACPTFDMLCMPAQRGSAGQRPSRGLRKALFGEIVPSSFKDLRFVRLEGFPAWKPLRDTSTARERCQLRPLRSRMLPNSEGRRLCRLCPVLGTRV